MNLSANQLEAKRLREIAADIRFAAGMADYRSNAHAEYALAKEYEAKANQLDPEGIAKPERKKWSGYM